MSNGASGAEGLFVVLSIMFIYTKSNAYQLYAARHR